MTRNGFLLALVAALLLPACDTSSPAAAEDSLDEVAFQELALGALEAADQQALPLPSLENLRREAMRTARANPEANAEGIALLRRARNQARLAAEARAAGDNEGAQAHANRSHALTLDAILAILGTGVADQALQGVDQRMAQLEARLAGKEVPARIQALLGRINLLSSRGQTALAAGNYRVALGAALTAADLVRSLSPRYQAIKAIERATRALRAAHNAVSLDATSAETDALRLARRYLEGAKDAYRKNKFRLAKERASESTKLSLEVLQGRTG